MRKMVEFKQGPFVGVGANVFLEALHDTDLPHSDLVIREALQNSYDARLNADVPVDFQIKGRYLSDYNKRFLLSMLPSESSEPARSLASRINGNNIFCIQIRDTNTVGLNGPYQEYDSVRHKQLDVSDECNYKNFVLSMGGIKDSSKGGAFGVGKTSLFLVSRVKTVCIYSRTKYEGRLQSRFIVKSFYPFETIDNKVEQYWFSCKRDFDGYTYITPLPFLDDEADEFASNIGMDVFGKSETGTCCLILDVFFEAADDEQDSVKKIDAREYFVEEFPRKIVHWFWPKLLNSLNPVEKQIRISIFDDENKLELDNPTDSASSYFAFYKCFQKWSTEYSAVRNLTEQEKHNYIFKNNFSGVFLDKPIVMLGGVSYVKCCRTPEIIDTFFRDGGNLCLVRMRDVEFCVNYKTFTEPSIEEDKVVFALFHTDPESCYSGWGEKKGAVDAAFGRSENKTHEKWNENNVTGRNRTYVKNGNRKILAILESLYGSKLPEPKGDVSGSLSTSLGRFLPYGTGFGASPMPKGGKPDKELPPPSPGDKITVELEMIGTPSYLDDGWREIKCCWRTKRNFYRMMKISPAVYTLDGGTVSDEVAEDRVIIEHIWYGKTDECQRREIRMEDCCIYLAEGGYFEFDVKVFGDIDFNFRLEVIKP